MTHENMCIHKKASAWNKKDFFAYGTMVGELWKWLQRAPTISHNQPLKFYLHVVLWDVKEIRVLFNMCIQKNRTAWNNKD